MVLPSPESCVVLRNDHVRMFLQVELMVVDRLHLWAVLRSTVLTEFKPFRSAKTLFAARGNFINTCSSKEYFFFQIRFKNFAACCSISKIKNIRCK
jgi:hypothetical protein